MSVCIHSGFHEVSSVGDGGIQIASALEQGGRLFASRVMVPGQLFASSEGIVQKILTVQQRCLEALNKGDIANKTLSLSGDGKVTLKETGEDVTGIRVGSKTIGEELKDLYAFIAGRERCAKVARNTLLITPPLSEDEESGSPGSTSPIAGGVVLAAGSFSRSRKKKSSDDGQGALATAAGFPLPKRNSSSPIIQPDLIEEPEEDLPFFGSMQTIRGRLRDPVALSPGPAMPASPAVVDDEGDPKSGEASMGGLREWIEDFPMDLLRLFEHEREESERLRSQMNHLTSHPAPPAKEIQRIRSMAIQSEESLNKSGQVLRGLQGDLEEKKKKLQLDSESAEQKRSARLEEIDKKRSSLPKKDSDRARRNAERLAAARLRLERKISDFGNAFPQLEATTARLENLFPDSADPNSSKQNS